jgi:hypothetical protein
MKSHRTGHGRDKDSFFRKAFAGTTITRTITKQHAREGGRGHEWAGGGLHDGRLDDRPRSYPSAA